MGSWASGVGGGVLWLFQADLWLPGSMRPRVEGPASTTLNITSSPSKSQTA